MGYSAVTIRVRQVVVVGVEVRIPVEVEPMQVTCSLLLESKSPTLHISQR